MLAHNLMLFIFISKIPCLQACKSPSVFM